MNDSVRPTSGGTGELGGKGAGLLGRIDFLALFTASVSLLIAGLDRPIFSKSFDLTYSKCERRFFPRKLDRKTLRFLFRQNNIASICLYATSIFDMNFKKTCALIKYPNKKAPKINKNLESIEFRSNRLMILVVIYVINCPDDFNMCLTNFIEHENGNFFSQRACVPSYLCTPGAYTKNNSKVTTKCCDNDLCIRSLRRKNIKNISLYLICFYKSFKFLLNVIVMIDLQWSKWPRIKLWLLISFGTTAVFQNFI
ncbi:hypothetical protein BpHYR1_030948 [Brachionus plicatilis]|uniref:Snake toxin/toxin-like domain-containing protein n=1 Tax=Brachionus plicatilis TaxID=10195 RepID=A0A3M7SVS3_BRAPC|nr:hypothetical protein BpHYR1_030948 [Brachionus plicatilis]